MRLLSIEGNTQRLDGGAMFGNAPREMWKHWTHVDAENRIPLASRCLYFEDAEGQRILFETGMGCFFEPRMRERYGVMEDEHMLLKNLEAHSISHEDIDWVILSHLHFDHVGGIVSAWKDGPLTLLFPNAKIVTGKRQWERARQPHWRDRASYVEEIYQLIEASGRLHLIEGEHLDGLDQLSFRYYEGHTPGMMLSRIELPTAPLYFTADLIPGLAWMHVPITMGYDRFPERTIDEKSAFLEQAYAEDAKLFLTHDPQVACSGIQRDERGKYAGFAVDIAQLTASSCPS